MVFGPTFSRVNVERIIGGGRVALAASSLFAIWFDPAEPIRLTGLTFGLHSIYLFYSVLLAVVMWRRDRVSHLPLVTHVADIAVASVFQYLTLGPSSPFFVYFVFALFSAALRWGARGTINTTIVVLAAFVVMSLSLSRTLGPTEFQVNRFIIRVAYLMVIAVLLVYLGQHEERLRDEVSRLARWPSMMSHDDTAAISSMLAHGAGIVRAGSATVVWGKDDEPWVYVASWPPLLAPIARCRPGDFEPVVHTDLADATFIGDGSVKEQGRLTVSRAGVLTVWKGQPVHADLLPRVGGTGIASAPFSTERVSGRAFFSDLSSAGLAVLPLVEVVCREIGASLDQMYSYERAREIAISEDRIRLARDLHDGVLQSLTGIRFELQNLAVAERDADPDPEHALAVSDHLIRLERTLGEEQRELRHFIEDLRPSFGAGLGDSLGCRLDQLKQRIESQWRVPVALNVRLDDVSVSRTLDRAVMLMVHEGLVNALRHANPSKVSVDVRCVGSSLTITVKDDGRGFGFTGRRNHAALLASNQGPISLRDRVSELGGQLDVESGPSGSYVELSIPLHPVTTETAVYV